MGRFGWRRNSSPLGRPNSCRRPAHVSPLPTASLARITGRAAKLGLDRLLVGLADCGIAPVSSRQVAAGHRLPRLLDLPRVPGAVSPAARPINDTASTDIAATVSVAFERIEDSQFKMSWADPMVGPIRLTVLRRSEELVLQSRVVGAAQRVGELGVVASLEVHLGP